MESIYKALFGIIYTPLYIRNVAHIYRSAQSQTVLLGEGPREPLLCCPTPSSRSDTIPWGAATGKRASQVVNGQLSVSFRVVGKAAWFHCIVASSGSQMLCVYFAASFTSSSFLDLPLSLRLIYMKGERIRVGPPTPKQLWSNVSISGIVQILGI